MDDFKILLEAVLDSSKIGEADIAQVQKVLDKFQLNLAAQLDKAALVAEIKKVAPELEAELKRATGLEIKIDDSMIEKSIKQVAQDEKRIQSEMAKSANNVEKAYQKAYQELKKLYDLRIEYAKIANPDKNATYLYETAINNQEEAWIKARSKTSEPENWNFQKRLDLEREELALQNKLQKAYDDTAKKQSESTKKALADDLKVNDTVTKLNEQLRKNTAYSTEAKNKIRDWKKELESGDVAEDRLKQINSEAKKLHSNMASMGKDGLSGWDKLKKAWEKFGGWSLATGTLTSGIYKIKEAITEIKELDNILTEISKTSDLTTSQLKELGDTAFESASKYGKKASDYLTGIQEMSRSGFYGKKGETMAEQSLLAQAAGDLNADVANKYVLATNAAYKLNGEAKKLNEILDGQNEITNRNSVALEDMATAMSEAGTVASSYRVNVEDLSAMIGTIESVTKLGGGEVGNAIKAILINLQNVTSSKIVNTLNAANASMTEMVNGAEKLRNPIAILRDLAATFNKLDEDDPLRAEILTNIGQKYHATKLSALLQNMDMFDKMLKDYSEGEGSAWEEANKSANNLTGSLNKLSNTWTDIVHNVANSDGLKNIVNSFNGLLELVNKVTEALGTFGTVAVTSGITLNKILG